MKVELQAPPPYEETGGPSTDVKLTLSENGGNNYLVNIKTPKAPVAGEKNIIKRAPVDLCCVIDVSGSMDDSAPAADTDGKKEETGLTVLDIVKHAMKTIMATMQEDDRLAIVTFSSSAQLVSDFTSTTVDNKKDLTTKIDELQTISSTNLWDGLKMGMNLVHEVQRDHRLSFKQDNEGRLASLFILTDGQPNIEPPRGHIPMLKQWLESHPDTGFSINSFGFGYDLDSALMSDIARTGGGHYGFIPDAGMIGTVFVHAIANLFSTYATNCYLNVELPSGLKLKKPRGEFVYNEASWGAKIDIGDLQYGQERDFLLEVDGFGADTKPDNLIISLVYKSWLMREPATQTTSHLMSSHASPHTKDYEYHLHRLNLVTRIYDLCENTKNKNSLDLMKLLSEAKEAFATSAKVISANLKGNPDAEALAQDIGGEVTLAVSEQSNWGKWGKHYFPSLARAHQMQRCNNFKDAGLQVYGKNSPLFVKSRDEADAAFDNLPPPKPTGRVRGYGRHGGGTSFQSVSTASWSKYNRVAGPCFTGDSSVTLADGSLIRLDKLRRGMSVQTPKGSLNVGAVIKTKTAGKAELCTIGELKVTPWHPIVHGGKWSFPSLVSETKTENCDAVYSVLLMPSPHVDAHAMFINNVQVVTLGHGLMDDNYERYGGDVRNHSFFGSYERVFDSLRCLPGFYEEEGICECAGVMRNSSSGLIDGFISSEETSVPIAAMATQSVSVEA